MRQGFEITSEATAAEFDVSLQQFFSKADNQSLRKKLFKGLC